MTAIYSHTKNWLNLADKLANSGLNTLTAGKDPGAGYGKAIIGDFSIMMPAAYSVVRNRNIHLHETISKDGCWVRYIEGSRLDLKDIQFFWGTAAIAQTDHTLLHEDKAKKAELALESIPRASSNGTETYAKPERLTGITLAYIGKNKFHWLRVQARKRDRYLRSRSWRRLQARSSASAVASDSCA